MKKLFLLLGVTALFGCMSVAVHAQLILSNAPRTLSYQGYLADALKKPLTGNHKISITIYDASVEGNTLHSENFTPTFDNGIFSVLIGSNEPLESALRFDKPYWLGVSIDGGAELYPRTALSSVPYAIHADAANALLKGATGAVTTLNGKSGDISIKGGDGTIVQSDGNTITITAIPTGTIGDIHTQATTVNSITGTNNQIIANGTTGSKQSGDVTLTLPQNINAAASPTFNNLTLSSMGTAGVVHNNGSGSLSSSLLANADVAANANIAASKLNLTNGITSGDIVTGTIVNSDISATAAIAGSKLNLANSITSGDIVGGTIVNSDISATAAIAGSKLNLANSVTSGDIVAGTIMNSDINAGANIAASKLNLANAITSGDIATGTIVNSDINGNAGITYSKLNLGGSVVNSDIAGGAAIAYNKLNLTGNITNGDIANGANISASKLNLTNAIVTGDIANGTIVNNDISATANIASSKLNLTNAIVSGDIVNGTIVNSDVNSAANIAYSKLNLTGSIVNTDIANGAAIADSKLATISTGGKVSNSATTATSSNTNNAIVARDGSGNFNAGTITATLNGNASNVSGTVSETHGGTGITTYTKGDILYSSASNILAKRAIGATGQVLTISGGVPVWSALSGVGVTSATGTANQVLVNGGSGSQITGGIILSLPQDINSGASPTFSGLTLSGLNSGGVVHNSGSGVLSTSLVSDADIAANAAIADTKLSTIATSGKVSNTATTATDQNTNNAIVARDASGGFSAGTINAAAVNATGKMTSASTVDADPPGTLVTKDFVDNIAIEYWSVGGNIGLDANNNYIGTNDATDLSFRTNSVEGMRLTDGGGVLFDGSSANAPTSGSGTRMMWVPSQGALRAGQATGSEWNDVNIGPQSVAMGLGTFAVGGQSVAMGYYSSASGWGSTALGLGAQAYVDGATAIGNGAQAAGFNSVAMGDNTTSIGDGSVALGSNTNAYGINSSALGSHSNAYGDYSAAIGNNVSAGYYDQGLGMKVGGDNSAVFGKDITVGSSSFAFNVGNQFSMDLTDQSGIVYFGNADVIIGNDDMTPRSLKFYSSNNSGNLLNAHFTSFAAGSQSADISYTLPSSQGSANSFMMNDGSGVLSWSSLSSLNVPTGSGSANSIALWNSSSDLGSASNLYYNSGNLGIGVTSPGDALDVSGDANISGTITSGSGITTNGITMSGGKTVLSYSDVSIASNGSITIPNVSVVNIQDDGVNNTNSVTMPSGTNGQIIYIYNNDAQTTSGDVTINAGAMGVYVYIGSWKKAN